MHTVVSSAALLAVFGSGDALRTGCSRRRVVMQSTQVLPDQTLDAVNTMKLGSNYLRDPLAQDLGDLKQQAPLLI
jgi:hypothetical protein